MAAVKNTKANNKGKKDKGDKGAKQSRCLWSKSKIAKVVIANAIMATIVVMVPVYILVINKPAPLMVTSKVRFKISINKKVETIEIGLFGKNVPITVKNFASIAAGNSSFIFEKKNKTLTYKDTVFHRIVKDNFVQGGDVTLKGGRHGYSIYGKTFKDESFKIKHYGAGWVGMATAKKDGNNSQFYITLNKLRYLDGKSVVFGKVLKGMRAVKSIQNLSKNNGDVIITKCEVLKVDKPFATERKDATN